MQINEIGKEMIKQDNRLTQYPMFAVYHMVERAVPDGQGESRRVDLDWIDAGDMCESCNRMMDEGKDLPDSCEECSPNCFFNFEKNLEPDLRAGVFFTAKACQEHIDANHYHYNEPVVYGIGCWRNEEMPIVQRHLIELAGEKVPSHYK